MEKAVAPHLAWEGAVTQLSGESMCGKTQLIAHVATGSGFLGNTARRTGVAVMCEDAPELVRRRTASHAAGKDAARIGILPPSPPSRLLAYAEQYGAELLIVDTTSAARASGDRETELAAEFDKLHTEIRKREWAAVLVDRDTSAGRFQGAAGLDVVAHVTANIGANRRQAAEPHPLRPGIRAGQGAGAQVVRPNGRIRSRAGRHLKDHGSGETGRDDTHAANGLKPAAAGQSPTRPSPLLDPRRPA